VSCQVVEIKHVPLPLEEEWKGELTILVMEPAEGLRKTISKFRDAVFDEEAHLTSTFKSAVTTRICNFSFPCFAWISPYQSIEWHSVHVRFRVNIADSVTLRM
jgi:hypothetical protein